MDDIKKAKKLTLKTLDRTAYRKYPLMVQALVEGELASMTVKPDGNTWAGNKASVAKAQEIYERLHDDTYLDENYTYVFRLAEDGIVLVAVYNEAGVEDMGQLITLGNTGEFTTPKLYPASLTPEDAVTLAKADGAIGLSLHFFDGSYGILKV